MLNKINKLPAYLKGIKKRIKSVGLFKTIIELFRYNSFYFSILKRNGHNPNFKTVLYHTAFYTKVVNLFPELTQNELMLIVPRSVTHGLYAKIKLDRTNLTYDKFHMYKHLSNGNIPIPEILLVTDENSKKIQGNYDFENLLLRSKKERVLVKPRFSNGGVGIHLLTPNDSLLPNHIYQTFVYNHPEVIKLQGSDFCGTIRYVLYNKSENERIPVAASIQMNGGKITDHMVNGGSYSASVDLNNGKLKGTSLDRFGHKTIENPLTKIKVDGFQLPHWSTLLKVVDETTKVFPQLPLIAFDLAITNEGVVVLEINAGCGTVAAQFNNGWLNHPFIQDNYTNIPKLNL